MSIPQPKTIANIEHRAQVLALREWSVVVLARNGALDARQVEAAFRFANTFRTANTDAGRQFREYVDGGDYVPLAEKQTDALGDLRKCRALLGKSGYELMCEIVGLGRAIGDRHTTRRQRDTCADRLRLHLDELASLWNINRT